MSIKLSLLRPIAANATFAAGTTAAGLVSYITTMADVGGTVDFPWAIPELLLDVYIVCAALTLLPHRIRPLIRAIAATMLYATAVADTFCYEEFNTTISPALLVIFRETTGGEAGEFVATYLTSGAVMSVAGLILLIAVCHLAVELGAYLYIIRCRHQGRETWWRRLRVRLCGWIYSRTGVSSTDSRACAIAAQTMAAVAIAACAWSAADNKAAMWRTFHLRTIGDTERELVRKDRAVMYRPIYRLAFSVYTNSLADRQIEILHRRIGSVRVDSCTFRSPNIVLVIGESYCRGHAQLYGYPKPTTPRQLRRSRRDGRRLVAYTDVVAPWNLTSFVFKHVFSLYRVGDKGEWCDYPLFPELFKAAGYRVSFITNQFLPHKTDAVYDRSGGFFLNDEQMSRAQFDVRNTETHRFDDGIIADYDRLRAAGQISVGGQNDHNLIILHLMGQHVTYSARCPQEQKKWKPADVNRPDLTKKKRWYLADYDNATLYNDSIVDQILRRFEADDAIVVYMPDHGEDVFGNCNYIGRNHTEHIDARLAHEEYAIPFWIWCSKPYVRRHPDIFRHVRAAKDRPFMTDDLPQLLLYLAGISCPEYMPERCLIAPDYDTTRRRLLKHAVDYDSLKLQTPDIHYEMDSAEPPAYRQPGS